MCLADDNTIYDNFSFLIPLQTSTHNLWWEFQNQRVNTDKSMSKINATTEHKERGLYFTRITTKIVLKSHF